jgi:3-hydroxyisobutyrate dehydrogenase-like beta-hydroxyacid dehydrogenase
MTSIGLVGAGFMGTGLGSTLMAGGHEVLTTTSGRSARTQRLVAAAGIATVADLPALAGRCDLLLVVTPPAHAEDAAAEVADAARTAGAHPLVADLNAISPSTVEKVAATLAAAGLDLVDGTISGPPPTTTSRTIIYLAGPRAEEVAALRWSPAEPIVVGPAVGAASAVKMCTASVYKGLSGLLAQALRTADHHGVLDHVLADLAELNPRPHLTVAMAATKADRFVGEMEQIAATQSGAGLTASLFQAYAEIYRDLAGTEMAQADPETLDRSLTPPQVLARLRPGP